MAHKPEQNSQAIESDLERLELIYKRAASNTERPRPLNRSMLERITSLITDYRSEHMRLRTMEEEAPSGSDASTESSEEPAAKKSDAGLKASKANGSDASRRSSRRVGT